MTTTTEQDPFLDKFGRSIFQYNPPPDSIDLEFYELRDIAREARKRSDRRTLILVGERIGEFYQRHPEYLFTCFTTSEMRTLYSHRESILNK
jgi:hypothetical protein